MTIDFSRLSRRTVWFSVAVFAGLIGLMVFVGNTGPKMMSAGEDAGATPLDLLGAWGPLLTCVIALFKGVAARDTSEVVNALIALAKDPASQELIHRAETAMLDRLRTIHAKNPTVLDAISSLSVEIAKRNHPVTDDESNTPVKGK